MEEPRYSLGKLRDFTKDWEHRDRNDFSISELHRYLTGHKNRPVDEVQLGKLMGWVYRQINRCHVAKTSTPENFAHYDAQEQAYLAMAEKMNEIFEG